MSCIENINRYIVPNDIIKSLMNVYKYIGRNDYYFDIAKGNINKIYEQTVERDAFYLGKLINLDLTEPRLRLIITKNSQPRNREEAILFNLVEVLNDIQVNYDKYGVKSNDQLNLINYIYQNQNIKFDPKTDSETNKNKRQVLDEFTDILYNSDDSIESLILTLNYFVDLYNLKPFNDQNKTNSLLNLYILLFKADIKCFNYVSFFETLYNNLNEFNDKLLDASYNWHEGITQPTTFIRFMIELIKQAYDKTEKIINDYKDDQNISKGDNIEHTIMSLPLEFTKDDIRTIHPYVSDSTINRALQKLRDENKIAPIGKGRSAKWRKVSLSNI